MNKVKLYIQLFLTRISGIRCGSYGGEVELRVNGMTQGHTQRWCLKRFGHSDSCAYDTGEQPGHVLRLLGRGWR